METNLPSTEISPSAPARALADALPQSWLWQPNLIVFISSGCIMVLELVAGRIIAPYVGVSLYTWTTVIGVVLAGISLGNYVGGRLADRWASLRFLGFLFLAGGLASLTVLAVDTVGRLTPGTWPVVLEILVVVTALFFLPSLILGTISPVVAKLAVQDLAKTGITVGKIYAFGTAGSIVGTFATGFVLISWFGTHTIVWGVALVLMVMGLLFVVGDWRGRTAGLVLLGIATVGAAQLGWLTGPCLMETNYFCIKVRAEEKDDHPVQVLILDRLVHSYSSLEDPTRLVYGYEKIYAEVTAYQAQQTDRLRALFIGGGGYTFPRYIEAVYPGSDISVIEIDPGVTQVAQKYLGLSADSAIVTHNMDARLFLAQPPTGQYNLIMGDAFNDFSVPYHLTTHEFNQRVNAWLAPDGLYMVNIIDGVRGDFLRAYVHTLRQTFARVYLAPAVQSWRESPRTTFVLLAGNTPLDVERLRAISAGTGSAILADRLFTEAELDNLLSDGKVVFLTDQYAPVDQMLAPVFRGETER